MKSTRRVFIKSSASLAALAAGSAMLAGNTTSAGTDVALFRVLHASPDAPALDVYVNRRKVAPNLLYTKFSGDWHYPATTAAVRVFTAGAAFNSTPLFQKNVTFEIGRSYVLAITGLLGQQQLDIAVFQDPPRPPAGQAAIRLAHVAPGVGNVDLYSTTNEPFILDVGFKIAKDIVKPAGTYELQVRNAGQPTVIFPIPPTNFPSAQLRTIYVFAPSQNAAARELNVTSTPQFVIR
jgi:hypothetical protein